MSFRNVFSSIFRGDPGAAALEAEPAPRCGHGCRRCREPFCLRSGKARPDHG